MFPSPARKHPGQQSEFPREPRPLGKPKKTLHRLRPPGIGGALNHYILTRNWAYTSRRSGEEPAGPTPGGIRMRRLWPILLLLIGVGCRSIPHGLAEWTAGDRTAPSPKPSSAPATEAQTVATAKVSSPEAARVLLASPAQVNSAGGAKQLLVTLPQEWSSQPNATIMMVPVPSAEAPPLSEEFQADSDPSELTPPARPPQQPLAPIPPEQQLLLERLEQIESKLHTLVDRVDQVEEPAGQQAASPSQILEARELPYEVGFMK